MSGEGGVETKSPPATSSSGTAATASSVQFFRQTDTNKRGIPEAVFIESVEVACAKGGAVPTQIVSQLQELYSKYQYMQSSLVAQRSSLKTKLPDICSALLTVKHLLEKRDGGEQAATEYTYQLSENIWSKASVPPTSVVCLWLGAQCMLEYTLDEALELLQTNEDNARTTLASLEEDMAFLRDQITTTEVNIARAHNYCVKLRQESSKDGTKEKAPALAAAAHAKAEKLPEGTGTCSTGTYTWRQEKDEVEVSVPVPDGTPKGDVKVTILTDSLRVELRSENLVEGSLSGRCSPDGSTWTLNKSRVEVSLAKADAEIWPSLLSEDV